MFNKLPSWDLVLESLSLDIVKYLKSSVFLFCFILSANYQGFILQFAEWKTAEDRVVYAVDTYPITMKPDGTKMVPNFGGDSLELLITTKCKLADHFRQLKEVDDGKSSCVSIIIV